MAKRVSKSLKPAAALPADYAPLLAEIKSRVQTARLMAGLACVADASVLHGLRAQTEILSQPVTESAAKGNAAQRKQAIVQPLLAQLPWEHHVAVPSVAELEKGLASKSP